MTRIISTYMNILKTPVYKVKFNLNQRCLIRPHKFSQQRRQVQPTALSSNEVLAAIDSQATVAYPISKAIILFTGFFCFLNWQHYRNIRLRIEEKIKPKDDNTNRK